MKHKHYEMIVAKAADKRLICFSKTITGEWIIPAYDMDDVKFSETGYGYFLCLPKHNENGQCLHWLNGGGIEILDGKGFYPFASNAVNGDWNNEHALMNSNCVFRIKPKKEKRWIATLPNGVVANRRKTSEAAMRSCVKTDSLYSGFNNEEWQFIEIEVEV